jgi:hypothetical protein
MNMKVNYIMKKLIILQTLYLQKAIFMDCQKCIKVKYIFVISNAILEQHTECIKISNSDDLRCRPIVGGPNCVIQPLSHFIDIMLKPLCCEVPSSIKDDL